MVINRGTERLYICEKCGFIITDDDLNYFVDEETNCVVEHASGMLTFDMGRGSKIQGKIIPSFCLDCSSEVYFYYNADDSYVKEINSAIKQDGGDFKDVLDEKCEHRRNGSQLKEAIDFKDKMHGVCPKCGKSISLIIDDKCECPKCGCELHVSSVINYD